jgi:hypothetical protein
MSKRKKKPPFVPRIVSGYPHCKCGTKLAKMISETKFKCVLCGAIYGNRKKV